MMRLTASFLALLIIATAASGTVWQQLAPARDGDAAARVIAFAFVVVGAVAFILLARLVTKAGAARAAGRQT